MGKTKNNDLEKIRHSSAHVMADAVKRLYPGVKMGIGPAIEDGFYYDFDFSECGKTGEITGDFLTPEDLPAIEKQMREIIQSKLPFKHRQISRQEAVELFTKEKETYKLELIEDLQDENITIYTHGDFTDLCRGPHVENTGEIGAFRLFSVAGAYWKGSEKNPMLQRIYGTAFRDKKELDEYLRLREEALKRDHRKLGKELGLFTFSEKVGSGLPLFTPKGAFIRNKIEETNLLEERGQTINSHTAKIKFKPFEIKTFVCRSVKMTEVNS
jgi:threonyl-tRNA synthetase